MIQVETHTLVDRFENAAEADPDKIAVGSEQGRLTYGELLQHSKALGVYLTSMTDRAVVATFLPMSPDFFVAFLGVMYANKAVLPLNMLLFDEELNFILEDAGCDLVIGLVQDKSRLRNLGKRVVALDEWVAESASDLERSAGRACELPRPREQDLCTILYTSGTTGKPKGVELTHRNVVSNTLAVAERLGVTSEFRCVACLPSFHIYSIAVSVCLPLLSGGSAFTISRFSPQAVLAALSEHKCNALFLIPSLFRLVVRQQERKPLLIEHLRLVVSGAEPLALELSDKIEALFGVEVLESFGQTESSPVITMNPPGGRKPGSIGPPLRDVKVKIMDMETLREVPRGERGEIWTHGPLVMKGYRNRPEESARAITRDGWLRTGDLGCMDDDGYVWITGRAREMIKVGGEMVFPIEVEQVLLRHPDVFEVGVTGVQDDRRVEAVKAFVVLHEGRKADEEAVLRFCRERLPSFRVPRSIAFVEALPKGPTGKIIRRLLEHS